MVNVTFSSFGRSPPLRHPLDQQCQKVRSGEKVQKVLKERVRTVYQSNLK